MPMIRWTWFLRRRFLRGESRARGAGARTTLADDKQVWARTLPHSEAARVNYRSIAAVSQIVEHIRVDVIANRVNRSITKCRIEAARMRRAELVHIALCAEIVHAHVTHRHRFGI